MIAGYHQDDARAVDLQAWNWKGIDVVNAHERHLEVIKTGIAAAADLVAANELDPFPPPAAAKRTGYRRMGLYLRKKSQQFGGHRTIGVTPAGSRASAVHREGAVIDE